MDDKIELLSVSLLASEKSSVTELKKQAQSLKLEFGWHYLLDLTWIIRHLETIKRRSIIDAGAGTGIMQWYLADKGARVISVDRASRADLPSRFRRRFEVEGLRASDLSVEAGLAQGIKRRSIKKQAADIVDILRYEANNLTKSKVESEPGMVIIYNQDLENLVDIADNSIDAIVAVSSLEHNSPEGLKCVVAELMRVLKPGCALFATLGAAKDKDWYHKPSQGWCFSEGTLRQIFNMSTEVRSNYDQYDRLFEALQNNSELQDNLASFYFRSGDNGMPWGEWDPAYQPVGICKVKTEN